MTALTVGVTTAHFPECKRGLAVNLAASLARDGALGARVCVVDADPRALDVTTRLAVRGPVLEDFSGDAPPRPAALGAVHEPPLWVLPCGGSGIPSTGHSAVRALYRLRDHFDVVICDLPPPTLAAGAGTLDGRLLDGPLLDGLDWLLVAVTPDVEPVEATAAFLARLDESRRRGEIAGSARVGVVTTGDEASTDLSPEVVARALRRPVLGSVPQLWGRSAPNVGFGAALGIAELDDAVAALFGTLRGGSDRRMGFEATQSRAS